MNIGVEDLVLLNIMRNGKLLPLQFAVKEKLNRNGYTFVFDEVGCGKTVEAGICIWDTVKSGGKNILIVAPSNLSFNWYAEILSKFGLDFKIIGGTKESIDMYYSESYPAADLIQSENLSNFCIVSYDSRNSENSNAALDRISKKDIKWDLIVLDEGHESKNENSNRYKALRGYSGKKVLFLSATPIKNLQEDFEQEFELVKSLIGKPDLKLQPNPVEAITFDLNYPISRNFKETLSNVNGFKKRNVYEIKYKIEDEIVSELPYDGLSFDQKRNCIMLFDNVLRKKYSSIFRIYRQSNYSKENVDELRKFDAKLNELILAIERIREKDPKERIVIFCNHIEVVNYLKKAFTAYFDSSCDQIVEAIHGESYEQEERKRRIFMLDKEELEMNNKEIVILSHNIGSVGVNLSKFRHLINYELPYTPADLEQRFGRIDRLTNSSDELNMYYFKDENQYFDTIYLNRILVKLNWEVLPLLPSKNILNTVSEALIGYYESMIKQLQKIEEYLNKVKGTEGDFIIAEQEKLDAEIRDLFGKSVMNNKKPVVNNIDTILKIIKDIKDNIGISDENDFVREIIKKYLESQANTVSYHSTEGIKRIEFNELKEKVFNNDYQDYNKKVQEECEKIKCLAKEMAEKYMENKELFFKEIELPENNDLLFSALYGVFCALRNEVSGDNNSISFMEIVKKYNGGY